MKISQKQFIELSDTLKKSRLSFPGVIRYGQFFCNKFPWLMDEEPTLFYETDESVAKETVKKHIG